MVLQADLIEGMSRPAPFRSIGLGSTQTMEVTGKSVQATKHHHRTTWSLIGQAVPNKKP